MFEAVCILVGEARRLCGLAHVGRDYEEDASCEEMLLVFTEAAPGPRLSWLGGPCYTPHEEGGGCRAADAAGHFYYKEVATSKSREWLESLARLCDAVYITGTKVRHCGTRASQGAAAVGRWKVEGVV